MISGLGIDIVPISILRQNMHRIAYLRQVYTPLETAWCFASAHPEYRFAVTFAIKEACMKALGSGIRQGVWFTQIECTRGQQISLSFSRKAANVYASMGKPSIAVESSIIGEFALAAVILEQNK